MIIARQAVVVVHGIGEQVPLETLRSFVGTKGPTSTHVRPRSRHRGGVAAEAARVFSEPSPVPQSCRDRIYMARWIHDRELLLDEAASGIAAEDRFPLS